MKQYDVVIPLRDKPSLYNDVEILYCLRSIEKYMDVNDVWMIGTPREYLSVNWIQCKDLPNRFESVRQKLLKVSENPYISDPFILFNDDFILTQKVNELPDYYEGTLDDRLKTSGGNYREAMMLTKKHSQDNRNYSIHVPCFMDKKAIKKTIKGGLSRNIILSHSKRDKVEMIDPKLYNKERHNSFNEFCKQNWCVSLAEGSLSQVMRDLERMFPEPSRWE